MNTEGLVVTLPMHGCKGRVLLNGQDISKMVRRIEIVGVANGITTARIEYVGAVAVSAEPGRFELVQAEHLAVCKECDKVLRGERSSVTVVDVTPMQPDEEHPHRINIAVDGVVDKGNFRDVLRDLFWPAVKATKGPA